MRCPDCSVENREGARFCRNCGLSLAELWAGETAATVELEASEPAEAPPSGSVTEVQPGQPDEPAATVSAESATKPAAEQPQPDVGKGKPADKLDEQPFFLEPSIKKGAGGLAEGEQSAGEADSQPLVDAGGPIVLTPGVGAGRVADTPPTEAPARKPGEVTPLVPIVPGTVIADRYLVIQVLEETEDQVLYHSLDLTRCLQCGFETNNLDDAFCAQCGAAMDDKPGVSLLQVPAPESEIRLKGGSWTTVGRFSDENGHFVVLAGLTVQSQGALEATGVRLVVGQGTDAGRVRTLNEDSMLVFTLSLAFESRTAPVIALLAVADGMGGHEGGEIASRLALQVLTREVIHNVVLPLGLAPDGTQEWVSARAEAGDAVLGPVLAPEKAFALGKTFALGKAFALDGALGGQAERLATILGAAAVAANDAVYLARQKRGNDMGTTLTAALVCDHHLVLAHVGDSRAYRWGADGLERLTTDHSLVARMIAAGDAKPEEVYTHPHRNVIYRSIGDTPVVDVDVSVLPVSPGDRLVLCSDGLWEMVRDEGIEDVMMMEADPQRACVLLVERANLAGGSDNISVIIAQVEAV